MNAHLPTPDSTAARMARIVRLSMEAHACPKICALAVKCGCRQVARRVLENFRFAKIPAGPGRPPKWSAAKASTLAKLLNTTPRLSEREIAERMRMTPGAVRYRVNALGVKRGRWNRKAVREACPDTATAWEARVNG